MFDIFTKNFSSPVSWYVAALDNALGLDQLNYNVSENFTGFV